jgi:hypothetical protein
MKDFDFIKQSATKAGTILNLTEWFDDLEFLRIYKYLHSMCGGDRVNMQHWMKTANKHLNLHIPEQLITTKEGTKEVLDELRYYFYL